MIIKKKESKQRGWERWQTGLGEHNVKCMIEIVKCRIQKNENNGEDCLCLRLYDDLLWWFNQAEIIKRYRIYN